MRAPPKKKNALELLPSKASIVKNQAFKQGVDMPDSKALTIGTTSVRQVGELYSLNDLHKASGGEALKRPGEFMRNQQTQDLVAEIANAGISAFESRKGNKGGTYACKELVIAYAAWISAAFHLKVIRVFLAAAIPKQEEGLPAMSLTDCGDKAKVGKYLIAARKRAVQHLAQLEKQITQWEVVDEVPAKTRQLLAGVKFVAHTPGQECTLHIICGDCGWSVQVPADGVPECGVVAGDKVRLEYDDAVNPLMGPFKRVVILERAKVTQATAMPPAQAKEVTDRLDRLGKLFHPFSQQFSDVTGISRALRGMDPKVGNRHHGFLPLLPNVGGQLGVAA